MLLLLLLLELFVFCSMSLSRFKCSRDPVSIDLLNSNLTLLHHILQGLLELGFQLPAIEEIEVQRDRWASEQQGAEEQLAALKEGGLKKRKAASRDFHEQQGWLKGAERFGAQAGTTEDQVHPCMPLDLS